MEEKVAIRVKKKQWQDKEKKECQEWNGVRLPIVVSCFGGKGL